MSVSISETVAEAANSPGTVAVGREVNASVLEVWRALTRPSLVGKWFGTLTTPLRLGEATRLDFGDGDFFDLITTRLDPPYHLQYTWRFLGIGPLNIIAWHIVPSESGCVFTVNDSDPGRSSEAASQLRKGWLDFTKRLAQYLQKGKPTRYDWRHDFEGSIEVAGERSAVWKVLFESGLQPQWLPINGSVLEAKAGFFVPDNDEPSVFRIEDVESRPPYGVQFRLAHHDWRRPTTCRLELSSAAGKALLAVSHTGWRAISSDKEVQKQQSKRFSAFWISSLQRASQLHDFITFNA